MSDTLVAPSEQQIVSAMKNEWGKEFELGGQKFEIKDLGYFDYVEFITLAKPLVLLVGESLETTAKDGEIGIEFNPAAVDFDKILAMCGKELPRLAWLICKQTNPALKPNDVAELARRPYVLVEIILLQIKHNDMIQEFASFFQRLTRMVTALMPEAANAVAPSKTVTE